MIQLVSSVACLLPLALTSWQTHAQAPLDSLKGDVMRTEKHGKRIVNTIVDRIPPVSQEATWTS